MPPRRFFVAGVRSTNDRMFSGAAIGLGQKLLLKYRYVEGIETGIELEALIECAQLAEAIVGHPLPGSIMHAGSLSEVRSRVH